MPFRVFVEADQLQPYGANYAYCSEYCHSVSGLDLLCFSDRIRERFASAFRYIGNTVNAALCE